jgi:hypothetical protein
VAFKMHYLRVIFLGTLIKFSAAAPADRFSVPATLNPDFKARSAYGWSRIRRHAVQSETLDSAGFTGSLKTSPVGDNQQYISPVTLGYKDFNLLFDTGSSDVWVFGPEVTAVSNRGGAVYDYTQSPTAQVVSDGTFSDIYDIGDTVKGIVVSETVTVGGVPGPNTHIGVATNATGFIVNNTALSGIFGLSPPFGNKALSERSNWFFRAFPSLQLPVFCASLKNTAAKSGSWDFGFIDRSKYVGTLHNVTGNSKYFWGFDSSSIRVGSNTYSYLPQATMIDSGTPVLLLAPYFVRQYYGNVPQAQKTDSGDWTYPCSSTLPAIGLSLGGGYYANVTSDLLNLGPDGAPGYCAGGVQEQAANISPIPVIKHPELCPLIPSAISPLATSPKATPM